MKTSQESRNEAVTTAYYAMLKVARQLLSTIEREELRFSLIRKEKSLPHHGVVHEFVNPLLYLRLDCYGDDGTMGIHYGFEPCKDYEHITQPFCRSVYKLSGKDASQTNIENSIRTDWFVHNPDDMFAYIEEQGKYHTFMRIKYKPAANKRKQMKAVA